MLRIRALALGALVVLWTASPRAADLAPEPRRPPAGGIREPVLEDDLDPGTDGDDVEPGEDDDLDEGRALPSEPSEPTLRGPAPRPVPRGQEEEPPPPGERPPAQFGPAEPASAAQPLSPG